MPDGLGWHITHDGSLVNLANAHAVYLHNGQLVAEFGRGPDWVDHLAIEVDDQQAQIVLRYLRSKIRQDVT